MFKIHNIKITNEIGQIKFQTFYTETLMIKMIMK